MSQTETKFATTLEAVVGSGNLTREPALRIDGLAPAWLIKPASAGQVAECLRVCSELNLAVVPAGRGTWLECGNPLRRADVVLSLEQMSRVIDYSPPDLTITVEAGMTLGELNEIVKRDRLWLPLDPPGASASSVGAIVACNSSGALRYGYGTPRDYVIGLKLVHADGSESKSGGRVAKNVAGYDLNKLYVGSYGTLAVITEVTFKLRPLHEQRVTIALTNKSPDERIIGLSQWVRSSELQPAAFVLTSMGLEDLIGSGIGYEPLLLRFTDNEAAVTYQLKQLRQMFGSECDWVEMSSGDDESLWSKVNDFDRQTGYAVRMSVPVSSAIAAYEVMLSEYDCKVTADLGSGIVKTAWDGIDSAAILFIQRRRAEAQKFGGRLFVEKAPASVKQQVDAWGEVGASEPLMRAIKEKFDPHGILNPGRFVAGI